MKTRLTLTVLAVFLSLGASMFIAKRVNAHQTVHRAYNYPSGTGYTKTYATCHWGYPDYDSSCVNGDYISVAWFARTQAQAEVDIEYGDPYSVNLNGLDDWWCTETLYCSDGSTPTQSGYGFPCGWTVCPSGVSASRIDVYFGINQAS